MSATSGNKADPQVAGLPLSAQLAPRQRPVLPKGGGAGVSSLPPHEIRNSVAAAAAKWRAALRLKSRILNTPWSDRRARSSPGAERVIRGAMRLIYAALPADARVTRSGLPPNPDPSGGVATIKRTAPLDRDAADLRRAGAHSQPDRSRPRGAARGSVRWVRPRPAPAPPLSKARSDATRCVISEGGTTSSGVRGA